MLIVSQIVTLWLAVGLYAGANVLLGIRLTFRKPALEKPAMWLVGLAVADHVVLTALRWIQVGHGPYIDAYEVLSSNALAVAGFYFLVALWKKEWRVAGAFVLPVVWLMLGIGAVDLGANAKVPLGTQNLWLLLHVTFAKFAYGSYLVAAGLSAYWLYLNRKAGKGAEEQAGGGSGDEGAGTGSSPAGASIMDRLELTAYRLVGFGFLMQAIHTASGSIWAKRLWGRYWGWDPIETWALVTWIGYGIFLHLKRTYRWTGAKVAWMIISLTTLFVFAFFAVPYLYATVHTAFLARG